MDKLLSQLKTDFPGLIFKPGEAYCWSPKTKTICYNKRVSPRDQGPWALLHEVGHALLDHQSYDSDLELLELESQAWEKAREISKKYGLNIDANHIEDCMDTYRDWLHQRSACPVCSTRSLQKDSRTYSCFNCGQTWGVSSSRFCRPYRRKEDQTKKSPLKKTSEATFV